SAEDGSAAPKAPENPDKAEQAAPKVEQVAPKAEQTAPKALTAAKATDQAPQSEAPAAAVKQDPDKVEKPSEAAKVEKPLKLQDAKRLFSSAATGDPIATIAMANIPRALRFGRLCGTELREQLLNASPPYLPNLLPRYEPGATTTIEIHSAAFSASG